MTPHGENNSTILLCLVIPLQKERLSWKKWKIPGKVGKPGVLEKPIENKLGKTQSKVSKII